MEWVDLLLLITLRLDIAYKMDDIETMKQLIVKGEELLNQLGQDRSLTEDILNFKRLSSDIETTNS